MWGWFTSNSIWIFLIAGLLFIIFIVLRERFQSAIINLARERWRERARKMAQVAYWVIEGLALLFALTSLTALVLSREGVYNLVNPETVQLWLMEHGIIVLAILVVTVIIWYSLSRFLPMLIYRSMAKPRRGESREGMKRRADTLVRVFVGTGRLIIVLIAILMILSETGVEIGPILAGFGVVGIAVGFGAQYLIRDLIAGVFILLENQYRVGDVARVADIAGLVEEVNLRKTVLRDLDGIVHHVPNGEIKVASNYSRHFARVNLNIPVSYGTDLERAISVINRVCQELYEDENWHKVFQNMPQVLRVDNLGDSGIDIKILGDVKPLQQWATMGELRLRIKKAFDAEGIEIPWPHTKVYFGNTPGNL